MREQRAGSGRHAGHQAQPVVGPRVTTNEPGGKWLWATLILEPRPIAIHAHRHGGYVGCASAPRARAVTIVGMLARSISQISGPVSGMRGRNVAFHTMRDPLGVVDM